MNVPVISMRTLLTYKTDKEFIENIPSHCICDNIKTFNALCEKYEELGISYVKDFTKYEIRS